MGPLRVSSPSETPRQGLAKSPGKWVLPWGHPRSSPSSCHWTSSKWGANCPVTAKDFDVGYLHLNHNCPVQFSCSVVSYSLRPHGLQHARLPCPSPTPRVYSNSCPSHQWCHPTISSSAVPFSSRLQSFPASGSFQMSQFFTSGGQSIRVSALASVLPMTIQDWFPLGWTGLISLLSKEFSRVFSRTQFKSISYSELSLLYGPALTFVHDYWKNQTFNYKDLCQQNDLCFLIRYLGLS